MRQVSGLPLRWQRLTYLRDLLRELLVREIKLRYERSFLGVAWSILNPLAQILIFTFLFRFVFRLDIPNYPVFVFTGVLAWNWFRDGLMLTTSAMTSNRELIRQPGFPLPVLPVVTVVTPLIDLLAALPVLVLFLVLGGGRLTAAILALPLVMAVEFLLILGLGYLLASVHVTFRDMRHVLGVGLMFLFYLTPVFYSADMIPEALQPLYNLNPMAHLIGAYRTILLEGTLPDWRPLLILAVGVCALLWVGWAFFVRASDHFVEEL